MIRTPKVVFEFLHWIINIGMERRYEVFRRDDRLVDEPRLVAQTQYTVNNGLNTASRHRDDDVQLKINHKVDTRLNGIKQLYLILLDVRSEQTWDPRRDDFYPLPVSHSRWESSNDTESNYSIQIDLTDRYIQKRRNNLDLLFPVDKPSGDIDAGSDDEEDRTNGVSGETYQVGTTANLRRIAEEVHQ